MFFNSYETQDALWDTSRHREPFVDFMEGYIAGRLIRRWLRRRRQGR